MHRVLVGLAILCSLTAASRPAQARDVLGQEIQGSVRIAVIGDYGDGSQAAADVAALVKSWQPDIVVTTGDNNYPRGAAATIDGNVGRFYGSFISPYSGRYGPGAATNRFFPTLGNHDWDALSGKGGVPEPYLDYFTLPDGQGEARYYEVSWGPVLILAVDSDYREPDGSSAGSLQASWLQARLAASTSPWKLVVMHEAPYSSGWHGSTERLRWPFQAWGATAVLSGHDHTYERVVRDGFPYFVNGLGGGSRYWFQVPVPGSQVRFNGDSGAMLVEADTKSITFRFVTRAGEEIDSYTLSQPEAGSQASPKAPMACDVIQRRAGSLVPQ
jgi:hypothetical protein